MQNKTDKMEHQESLQVITKMLAQTRKNIQEQHAYYLIWGWLAIAAAGLQLILLNLELAYHWIGWPLFMGIGGIISSVYSKKQQAQKSHGNKFEKAMSFLWIGVVCGIFFFFFLAQISDWKVAYLGIIMLYGLGTFVSGGILEFKPLIIGGVLAWIVGLIGVFISSFAVVVALLILAVIVSYIIPGYLLKSHKGDLA